MTKHMPHIVHYKFTQAFNVPAEEAYRWCTDYSPDDPELMAEANQKREVTRIGESALILKETFQVQDGVVVKEKLVQLYPERYMWISTHISGPSLHSQFIYEIAPKGKAASELTFTGAQVEHKENLTKKQAEALAAELCSYDAQVWRLLAAAMQKQLKP